MNYIEIINNFFLENIKIIFNLQNTEISYRVSNQDTANFIKLSTMIFNLSIISTIILMVINYIIFIFFNTNSKLSKIIQYFNMLIMSINLCLLILKFYISLKVEKILGYFWLDIRLEFFEENNNLSYLEYFIVFSSSFSDGILILSYLTGVMCLELLGPKNLFKNINNINIFFIFTLIVTIMVSTNNLLIMFICFEFLFLPTMYFAYKLGYSKKIDKATESLFYWTLFGSFLVLCCLIYVYNIHNTLNYLYLIRKSYSKLEIQILFILIFSGFAIKIPLAPLHFWLLRVHVEAPTAFSIFLSGFLVKSALYCLFMIISIFDIKYYQTTLILWTIYSLIVATIGLGRQIDIKKLIAWATVQEMSFMLIFLMFKQSFLINTFVLFVVLHGIMSSYMFYIVDIIQRRYKTRALQYIKGLHLTTPKLIKHVWFLILLFSGFPLTAKFILEWYLVSLMIELNTVLLLLVILTVNFLGVIFFSKVFFTILYGILETTETDTLGEIQKKEYILLNFLTFIIIALLFLMYYL